MRQIKLHVVFGIVGVLSFLVATNGFEILASVLVARTPLHSALRESVTYSIAQPVSTFLLALPFLIASALGAEMVRAFTLLKVSLLLSVVFGLLGWLYFSAYWNAQLSILEHRWTSSALSIGLLPFKSIPILFFEGTVVSLMFWKSRRNQTGQTRIEQP